MMAVHEFGHVLHAWASGGVVTRVVLHPLAISRTDVQPNPHPLFVAAGGAIWGCLLPLLIWPLTWLAARDAAFLARFFAGFCLIANGAYLAGDAFLQGGDGRELVLHGCPPWVLVAIGLPFIACGLRLWHRQGPSFGLGETVPTVNPRIAWAVTLACVAVAVVESWLSSRS